MNSPKSGEANPPNLVDAMRRTLWTCDRCQTEFKYSDDWGEQPINYVASGGPPRKADLCECCSASLERFLAGAELERQPDQVLGVIQGENQEATENRESIIEE